MKLYWLPLLDNLRSFMLEMKCNAISGQALFENVDIGIGQRAQSDHAAVELVWALEAPSLEIKTNASRVEFWIDCYSGQSSEELYKLQYKVRQTLDTWPAYLAGYTFPGGKKVMVQLKVNKLTAMEQTGSSMLMSRFVVELTVRPAMGV